MANRMEKNTMQTHRFNLKSIVETLKKLVRFLLRFTPRLRGGRNHCEPRVPQRVFCLAVSHAQRQAKIRVEWSCAVFWDLVQGDFSTTVVGQLVLRYAI